MKNRVKESRSSHPELFLGKQPGKQFTGEQPWGSVISIKLLSNLIEVRLWHGCSAVSLLHIFRTPFPKNTTGWLLLREHNKTSRKLHVTHIKW